MLGSNLFGTQTNPNTQPQQQATGMFGGGGGLFGNVNPLNQQQPQQFQQQPQQQPQQGLWGNNVSQPSNFNKGLFSQPTTTPGGMGGGIFGSTPSTGTTGKILSNNLGIFGSSTGGATMQTPGMGFSNSIFPQATSTPGMMTQTGTTPIQPTGGMFGTTSGLGGGGIFGGATTQPTGNTQASGFNIFGQTQPQTGMQPTQPIGTGMNTGMTFGLGNQQQQQNPPTGTTGLFGNTTATPTTNVFGGVTSNTTGGLFGQGAMGTTTTMQQPTSNIGMIGKQGLFGSTMGQTQPQGFQQANQGLVGISTGIGQTQVKGTHMIKYQPTRTQETSSANGSQRMDNIFLNAITAMGEFTSKSLEELRYEDYVNKKLGIVPKTMGSGLGGMMQQPTSVNTSMLGNQLAQPTTGSFLQGTQKITPFQTTGLQPTQPFQSTGIGGNIFQTTTTDNKPGLFQTQTQNQPTQSGAMGMFQTSGGSTSGLFTQPQQQQTTGLLGMSQPISNLGTTLFQPKSILSPSKTTQQQQPSFGGLGTTTTTTGGGLFRTATHPSGLFGTTTTTTTAPATTTSTSLFGPSAGGFTGGLTSGLTGGLTGTSAFTGGLTSGLGTQPTTSTTGGLGLFNQLKPQTSTSLFGTATTMQPTQIGNQPSLLDTSKIGIGTSMPATQGLQTSLFTPTVGATSAAPTQPLSQPITQLQVTPESADFKNYLTSSMYKQKSISELLNDLQRHYLEQDFFLNDDYSKKQKISREINLGESKYSYPSLLPESRQYYDYDHQKDKYDFYGSFLKSKRTQYQPKTYGTGGKGLYKEPEIRKVEEPKIYKPQNLLDFQFKKDDFRNPLAKEDTDDVRLKKSHSCDLIKKNEAIVINHLEKSFNSKVNLDGEFLMARPKKLTSDNIQLDLHVSLQEPIKTTFNLKISKNSKVTLLKTVIVDYLKEKYSKYFKKLNINSFVLMKKYSILKDGMLLSEAEVRDGETIHILLKENFNTNNNTNLTEYSKNKNEDSSNPRKESKTDKKKRKNNSELAPLNKLPILNKSGYKTNPDLKNICRMTLDELENVENFSIYNEHGKIDFEGTTNLTNLNLDQIVTIENKKINVYQNEDLDYKPRVGQGLNKPAVVHLYNCFPSDCQKGITDEQLSIYLATLQKICKDKGAEFKSYDENKGEWIFRVEHF